MLGAQILPSYRQRRRWAVGFGGAAPGGRWKFKTVDMWTTAPTTLICLAAAECIGIAGTWGAPFHLSTTLDAPLLRYSNGTWKTTYLPAPANVDPSKVSWFALSCGSSHFCVVLGHYLVFEKLPSGDVGLSYGVIDQFRHGKWTSHTVAAPSGVTSKYGVDLSSVACRADRCIAVGAVSTDAGVWTQGHSQALIATESAGRWKSIRSPLPGDAAGAPNQQAALYSVSCAPTGGCVAVGGYTGRIPRALVVTQQPGRGWKPSSATTTLAPGEPSILRTYRAPGQARALRSEWLGSVRLLYGVCLPGVGRPTPGRWSMDRKALFAWGECSQGSLGYKMQRLGLLPRRCQPGRRKRLQSRIPSVAELRSRKMESRAFQPLCLHWRIPPSTFG